MGEEETLWSSWSALRLRLREWMGRDSWARSSMGGAGAGGEDTGGRICGTIFREPGRTRGRSPLERHAPAHQAQPPYPGLPKGPTQPAPAIRPLPALQPSDAPVASPPPPRRPPRVLPAANLRQYSNKPLAPLSPRLQRPAPRFPLSRRPFSARPLPSPAACVSAPVARAALALRSSTYTYE